MNDTLKKAEELEAILVESIGTYKNKGGNSRTVRKNIKSLLSIISSLTKENDLLKKEIWQTEFYSASELGATREQAKQSADKLLKSIRSKTLDELTALSQEMGDYE